MPPADRELDVVVWGATGFTGKLVAERLVTEAQGARWAIAGRDRAKLQALGLPKEVPILVGDANDPRSLDEIAARTRVVCSTVGPYMKYGAELVAACVRAGTSYCDLTGEPPFVRKMIDLHHDAARASGARIVHCCGFDSIPSDLGVLMLHDAARTKGDHLARVDMVMGETSGGLSGGTIASMLNLIDLAREDKEMRRLLADPYALDPTPRRGGPDGPDQRGLRYERRLGKWTAPFVMAAVNTRVVRRTNAITGYPYGEDFRYTESMAAKNIAQATALTAGIGAFLVGSQIGPLRKLIDRRLPSPGEGPSERSRARGHFRIHLLGETRSGAALRGEVSDQRDPGYGSTAVMLSEAALCLARDSLTSPGGVLTPAAAMGTTLIERLRGAGMTFELGSP